MSKHKYYILKAGFNTETIRPTIEVINNVKSLLRQSDVFEAVQHGRAGNPEAGFSLQLFIPSDEVYKGVIGFLDHDKAFRQEALRFGGLLIEIEPVGPVKALRERKDILSIILPSLS